MKCSIRSRYGDTEPGNIWMLYEGQSIRECILKYMAGYDTDSRGEHFRLSVEDRTGELWTGTRVFDIKLTIAEEKDNPMTRPIDFRFKCYKCGNEWEQSKGVEHLVDDDPFCPSQGCGGRGHPSRLEDISMTEHEPKRENETADDVCGKRCNLGQQRPLPKNIRWDDFCCVAQFAGGPFAQCLGCGEFARGEISCLTCRRQFNNTLAFSEHLKNLEGERCMDKIVDDAPATSPEDFGEKMEGMKLEIPRPDMKPVPRGMPEPEKCAEGVDTPVGFVCGCAICGRWFQTLTEEWNHEEQCKAEPDGPEPCAESHPRDTPGMPIVKCLACLGQFPSAGEYGAHLDSCMKAREEVRRVREELAEMSNRIEAKLDQGAKKVLRDCDDIKIGFGVPKSVIASVETERLIEELVRRFDCLIVAGIASGPHTVGAEATIRMHGQDEHLFRLSSVPTGLLGAGFCFPKSITVRLPERKTDA